MLTLLLLGLSIHTFKIKNKVESSETINDKANNIQLTEYEASDMVELGEYKEMTVSIDVPDKVTETDLKNYVNKVLLSYPKYNLIERINVEKKDCVEIDLVGILKGEDSPCVEDKGIIVELSNSDMIKEIQSALVGKSTGDSFDVEYTYPDNFADAEYSGKTIVFKINVKNIYEKEIMTYQTLTEDYARNVLGCRTVDEFLSQIKTEMYEIITTYETTAVEEAVVNKILSTSSFHVPEEYYELKFQQEQELFINQYCNGDESLYEKQIYNYTGLQPADYEKTMRKEMKDMVHFELVATLIAEKEEYTTESAEYKSFINTQLDGSSISDEKALYELTGTSVEDGKDYVKKQFYMQIATEYLVNNVTVERTADANVTDLIFTTEN